MHRNIDILAARKKRDRDGGRERGSEKYVVTRDVWVDTLGSTLLGRHSWLHTLGSTLLAPRSTLWDDLNCVLNEQGSMSN